MAKERRNEEKASFILGAEKQDCVAFQGAEQTGNRIINLTQVKNNSA